MLPPAPLTSNQHNLMVFLGSIYYRRLGDYRSNHIPYPNCFQDERVTGQDGPLIRFRNRLKEIEGIIEERNKTRDEPYTFLLPGNIPNSINI